MGSIRHQEVFETLQCGKELHVQSIEFTDKLVIFIREDGEVDTTFDVQTPDSGTMFQLRHQPDEGFGDFTSEKVCLVGDNTNIKLSLLVNHVSKLLYSNNESRNLIISMSSKIFHPTKDDDDFNKLIVVLELVKRVI
jgi:hypothetical protein